MHTRIIFVHVACVCACVDHFCRMQASEENVLEALHSMIVLGLLYEKHSKYHLL